MNQCASGSESSTATSQYIGVRKRKYGRWVTEIREPGKKTRIWLGSYDTPEMAAVAYDVAALHLKGADNARLNFPEFVGRFPKPASNSPDDIRQAAQQAAAMQVEIIGSGGGAVVPERVELSASQIQAINEAPLDSPKMSMEVASVGESSANYEGTQVVEELDEMDPYSYTIWD
ncbi:hypothetical protein RD792_011119 [Penstemon davidsonii]|uniref:AP2/ERF domain-containing protein n=1 Tax=Penstemon davidsonii TaxID=160366 RepID=A0ABR0D4J1_9LAMI|nr:hypothetical protein RD792_011119 [Penstemon davidsonii]